MERFEKKHYSLKMYIPMEYQSILHEKNTVRFQKSTIRPMFQAMCMVAPEPSLLDFTCPSIQPVVAIYRNLFQFWSQM